MLIVDGLESESPRMFMPHAFVFVDTSSGEAQVIVGVQNERSHFLVKGHCSSIALAVKDIILFKAMKDNFILIFF